MNTATLEHDQKDQSLELGENQRPSFSRLALYFIVSWSISGVASLATMAALFYFFDVNKLVLTLASATTFSALNMVEYAVGGFVLGSLIGKRMSTWVATAVDVFPSSLMSILSIAGCFGSFTERVHANPIAALEIVYLLMAPFVCFYSIRRGQNSGYARPNTLLGISWQHWIWIAPTSLFPLVCVPLFLLLLLWKIDFLNWHSSTFSLPYMIPRIIVGSILLGVIKAIKDARSALSETTAPKGKRILTVASACIVLAALQILIICSLAGKFSQFVSEENTQPSASLDGKKRP